MNEREIENLLNRRYRMLIGGELVYANDQSTMQTINPATQKVIGEVPDGSIIDVDAAVEAAKQAQPRWVALTLLERQHILSRVAAVLRAHTAEWGALDCLENGNVYSAMQHDAAGGADVLDYFIAIANEVKGESTQLDHNLHYTRREPFGVVARLLPFNHPIASLGSALGAPLLMGNTLIIKPSPHTSLSALAFAEAIKDIVPPGVINIVTGGNERVSQALMGHPGIPRVSATGSTEVGRMALKAGAEHLKTVTLELGGKTPMIVFDDADIDLAVDTAVRGMNLKWQGHSCSSTSRVLIHESLHDDFVEKLANQFRNVVVGMQFDDKTEMGAISHQYQFEKIQSYIKGAQQQGAEVLFGGGRPEGMSVDDGLFMKPTILTNVTSTMSVAQEEIYGPVISIIKWQHIDEAIQIANDVDFGLAAVILTQNLSQAHRTAHAIRAGYVEINGPVSFAKGSPFGGIKHSGIGNEGNMEELLSYTQLKSVNIQLSL